MKLPPEAQQQLDDFRALQQEIKEATRAMRVELARVRAEAAHETQRAREFVEAMLADQGAGAGLIAEAWADYETAVARARADVLRAKSRPAKAAADEVREKGKQLAELRREAKRAGFLLKLYEHHVPWLSELREDGELGELLTEPDAAHEDADPDQDPVARWLEADEYASLLDAERNQLALDRYITSRKSRWQVGRDYERYIGYLREQAGGTVVYHGIFEGFDDLGRDLLVRTSDGIEVVQCKRWAKHKTIHENHVFQLFGTVVACRIENPDTPVTGTFVTTTSLSDRAKKFAEQLEITVQEHVAPAEYPMIKCNVGNRTGERIYHLPFDDQYDTTVIDRNRGEMWAWTTADAVGGGFRRAWRWRGNSAA